MPKRQPESRQMRFARDELHTMSIALMAAIEYVSKPADAGDLVLPASRADLLPKMRSLLDRFQN